MAVEGARGGAVRYTCSAEARDNGFQDGLQKRWWLFLVLAESVLP